MLHVLAKTSRTFTSWFSPVTTKSVKKRIQQQQKLTGLLEAASEGRKRRLRATLLTHNTAACCDAPSMAERQQQHAHAGQTELTLALFLPQDGGAQEFRDSAESQQAA